MSWVSTRLAMGLLIVSFPPLPCVALLPVRISVLAGNFGRLQSNRAFFALSVFETFADNSCCDVGVDIHNFRKYWPD